MVSIILLMLLSIQKLLIRLSYWSPLHLYFILIFIKLMTDISYRLPIISS